MRKILLTSTLAALAFAKGCGGTQTSNAPARNSNANSANTTQTGGDAVPNMNGVGVVSSHGGGAAATTPSAGGTSDRSLLDTSQLDARIKKAAEKAKASGASAADKKAAAEAYLARGNEYYSAGQPRLYKYALADFREVLKYDPDNSEAKEKVDTIVSIYQSMGRPVPEVSPEP
ncbi:MAG TPA: tetratricopeptide repeat protein [Pyrinomonadaceae bacterium]|nr:tetratricopeptide repeat protein [Pyrinomonadaceae bacterium]